MTRFTPVQTEEDPDPIQTRYPEGREVGKGPENGSTGYPRSCITSETTGRTHETVVEVDL